MKKDNLYFDAQHRLQNGIEKIAQAVGSTMGTAGSNAIIERIENPGHIMTNDGYSIANAIKFADPIEDMGRKILLESINRANKASGDGSSTTCVTTAAIIKEGLRHTSETHPMTLKREMEDCLPLIKQSLEDQSVKVIDDNGQVNTVLMEQVATISAEDPTIGKMIADIYKEIGKDGIIYWDTSKTPEDSYKIGTGITMEGAGYVTPYLCDATDGGQNTMQVRIKKPKILITKQKLTNAAEVDKIAAALYEQDVRDLIVFCNEIEPLMLGSLVQTRLQRGFRVIPVKMPVLWQDQWYEDLAKVTGAQVIDPTAGLSLKDVTLEHLGTVENILVTQEDTFLDGIKDISDYVQELKDKKTDDDELRASRLNTKTARYYVGAHSESALSYRRLKVEDAIGATHHALQNGIVPGGGVALLNTTKTLPDTVGGRVLKEALKAPINQIIKNSGKTVDINTLGGTVGFNTVTGETTDMMQAGIVDPVNVVYNAVENAISVSATVLTAPTIVSFPYEDTENVL